MLVAALFGKGELDIPSTNLIHRYSFSAIDRCTGAYVISKLSAYPGNLRTLMLCVLLWVGICIYGYIIPRGDITQFYIISSIIGFVMGGTQSLSRSTYSKLMPVTKDTASFFSFYDVTEKISLVVGLFLFGFLTEYYWFAKSICLSFDDPFHYRFLFVNVYP
jgi:UMF1 family MFS transporter